MSVPFVQAFIGFSICGYPNALSLLQLRQVLGGSISTHIADLCCVSFPHVQILGILVQEELELLEVATFLDRTLIVVQNYLAFLQSVFLIK